MTRPYDPDLDYLHVQRNGTILLDGEEIGHVTKLDPSASRMVKAHWRAETGDPANPDAWPGYRAAYGTTRASAVGAVMDGLQVNE